MIIYLIFHNGEYHMKRFALGASGAFLAAALLGLTGCDSGGIEEGIPKDTAPAISPEDMGKMTQGIMKPGQTGPTAAPKPAEAPKEAATPEKK
jgi:hypothetical protein